MLTREAIERVVNGAKGDAMRCLFEQTNLIEGKVDALDGKVDAWPAQCAEHRLELERRIANGKAVLGIPEKTKSNGLAGLKPWIVAVLGFGLFFGALIAGFLIIGGKALGLI